MFKPVLSLSLIMCFRMLGLFMILPVFAVAVSHMPGGRGHLLGIALGVYGLTQAALQIPFALASDRIGRKPMIIFGLLLFALGSVVAAMAHSMPEIIIGRALQGSGAVGSTLLALLADLTSDEKRTAAMAVMGMSIGLAFCVAMVLGPLVSSFWGLSGIFWFTALMALVAVAMVLFVVPTPNKVMHHRGVEAEPKQLFKTIMQPRLLVLDFGIFSMHAILTSLFVALPHILGALSLSAHEQTVFYLLVLLAAVVLMIPGVIIAEKKRKIKPVMALAIIILGLSLLMLYYEKSVLLVVVLAAVLFFAAFTLLESILPSLVSKVAPLRNKGTAMGIYSTSQFLGIFAGGIASGYVWAAYGAAAVLIICVVWALLWLILHLLAPGPIYTTTWTFKLGKDCKLPTVQQLRAQHGIFDAFCIAEEKLVMVKADKLKIEKTQLRKLLEDGNL